jgi:serine phosphatase RsbU (regulator of sigma subunit)
MGKRPRSRGLSVAAGGALAALNGALAAVALRQRRRARAARSQFDQALATLSEAVTITDAERRIRYANKAAADILGFASPEELMASPPGTVRDQWTATRADGTPLGLEDIPSWKVVRGRPAEPLLTHIVHRETGEDRWRLVKATPLSVDGELLAVSVIEDVTEAKEAELRQRFLAEAGEVLSSSLDYGQTLRRVAELAVPALADWCAVDVLDERGISSQVAVVHVDPAKVAFAHELRERFPPDPSGETGLYAVMRGGRPELYRDIPDELLAANAVDPEQLEMLRSLGMRSVMIVPMTVAGHRLGAVTFVSSESGRAFDDDDLGFAEELARRAAVAVQNARLFTERARASHTLQQSLLPAALPDLPGWSAAAAYRPGAEEAEVGGDFYDVVALEDGFVVFVGDVTGKGIEAAALTSLARYTLATAARFDPEPVAGLRLLDELLAARPAQSLLTVASAWVRDADLAATMRLSCAGHPQPLLRRGGDVVAVGRPDPLLGMRATAERSQVDVDLQAGDLLLFYTDGVIEAPGAAERFGVERLREAVASAPADPRGLVAHVEEVLRSFQEGDVGDDLALLALQKR